MTPRPTQKTLSPRAWGELAALSGLWGASFLAIRIALDEVSLVWMVTHRVLWAAVVLWLVLVLRGERLPRDPAIWAAFAVMGLLNNVIPFSLMGWGQLHIETGLTAILNATTAPFGLLVAALCFADERLTLRKALGTGVAFFGVATTIGLDNLRSLDLRSLAQLAVLAGTFSYALAGAWSRVTLARLKPEVAATGMLTASAAMMLPAALILEGPPDLSLEPRTIAATAYFAIASTALAYLLYYRVLAMAGAANLLLCTLLVAPISILLGAVVLGERLPPQALAGFSLLAAGLAIIDGRIFRRRQRVGD